MWFQLLLNLVKNNSAQSGTPINQSDLETIQKKAAESGTTGVASIFNSISFETLSNLNYEITEKEDGTIDVSINSKKAEDLPPEEKSIMELIKQLFSVEEVKEAADINKDGKIEDSEIKSFLGQLSAKDGNAADVSIDDFSKMLTDLDVELSDMIQKAAEDILKTEVETPETETPEVEVPEEVSAPQAPQAANNAGGNYNNYGNSGNSNRVSSSAPKEAERTPDVIRQEITSKETEIKDVNTEKEGQIKTEQEKYDEAVKQAMKDQEIDQKIQQEYQDEDKRLDGEITLQNGYIQTAETAIQNNTAIITSKSSAKDAISGQITSLENSKEGIKDTDDAEKNKDNAAKRADIDGKIKTLKENQTTLQTAIDEAKEAKAKAESDKSNAEKAKAEAEKQKSELLQTFAKKYPDAGFDKVQDKTKDIKTETDKAITTLKNEQKTAVDGLNKDIQELKTELAQAEEKEKTVALLKANKAPGNASGAIDFADVYENMTESEMRQVFADKGYQFDSGAWCADFVRMALCEGVGKENLPEWYQNSANPAYCPTLYNEAKENNAIIDIKDAKPGDMVLFDWEGDGTADHVGILVDNGNGVTIKTIEGNTSHNGSGSCVAYKERDMSEVKAIVSMGG